MPQLNVNTTYEKSNLMTLWYVRRAGLLGDYPPIHMVVLKYGSATAILGLNPDSARVIVINDGGDGEHFASRQDLEGLVGHLKTKGVEGGEELVNFLTGTKTEHGPPAILERIRQGVTFGPNYPLEFFSVQCTLKDILLQQRAGYSWKKIRSRALRETIDVVTYPAEPNQVSLKV